MSLSRRTVVQRALAAAIASAAPSSLFSMAEASTPDRFLVVTLRDGRLLAIDRLDNRKAFLLSRSTAHDGDYALSRGGSVEVRGGALRAVKGNARTDGHLLVHEGGQIVVKTNTGAHVLSVPVSPAR